MKTKKKSCSIVLTLTALALFLILVSSVASAYSVQSVSPTITEAQITANRSASCPAINGDKIVYQDSRNGTSDIHMYDLFTSCLLYTSDAADEEDSVDLGGRRIIK